MEILNKFKSESQPLIYTTGAFLKPLQVIDSLGVERWMWFVSEFTDDSYFDGEIYNPLEFANSKEELTHSEIN